MKRGIAIRSAVVLVPAAAFGVAALQPTPEAVTALLMLTVLIAGFGWIVIRVVRDGPWPARSRRSRDVTEAGLAGAPYLAYTSSVPDCASDALGSAGCDGGAF